MKRVATDATARLSAANEREAPKVQLTAEEKKENFFKHEVKDLTAFAFSASFPKFSLPAKDEGFDEVKFEWSKGPKCEEYLKNWVSERKLSIRVEDLKPSPWFTAQLNKWQATSKTWGTKLNDYKAMLIKKAAEKTKKEAAKKAAAARAEAEKAKEGEEKKEGGEEQKEGEEQKDSEEKKEPEAMEVEEEEEEEAVDFEGLDVFGVEDVANIGASTPLCKEFQFEDWAMMQLRFELHLLVHAFRKDVDDPERLGIHLDHLPFYYNKYFKKNLAPKDYGVESVKDIIELVPDAVYLTPQSVLATGLVEEMESFSVFPKLAEEARRHRNLRIALGQEEAKLKLAVANNHGGKGGKSWGNNQQHQGGWQKQMQTPGYGKAQDKGKGKGYQPYGKDASKGGYGGGWQQKSPMMGMGFGKDKGFKGGFGGKGWKGGKGY